MDLTTGHEAGARREATEVVAWRRTRLRHAGFDAKLAEQLVARIPAPLDHERRAS